MQDLLTRLNALRRPKLLIRAARFGAAEYRRDTQLPRLLGYGATPRCADALMRLMAREAEINDKRKKGDAGYSIAQHVEILTAVMGEARLLRAQSPSLRVT